ncbi:hypothetical protein ACROYT_G025667 [Oculina patagonica]
MLHVLRGVNNDLVAAKAKYHKVCHSSYVAKKIIEHQTLKLEASEVSPYQEQARSFSLEDVVKDGESCMPNKAQKADRTNVFVQSSENPDIKKVRFPIPLMNNNDINEETLDGRKYACDHLSCVPKKVIWS